MVTVREQLVRPRVLAALEDLSAQGASGVFEVVGNPSGAIYLDGGRITFARASWAPGLAPRLRAACPALPMPPGSPGSPGPEPDDIALAGLAVQHGCLGHAALAELLRSIVVDAFLVLTVPLAADSPVAAIRFASTSTYWNETFPRLGLGDVRGEALRLARRMAEYGLSPTTDVALRDLATPVAVLTRQQWSVASRIADQASARELAMRCGGALSDTVECLGTLIRVGVCAPARASGGARLPSLVPGQGQAGRPSSGPSPAERLPVRRPTLDLPMAPSGPGQPPTADVLHQVLSGLRKLS